MIKRYKLINGVVRKFDFITLPNGGVIYTTDESEWAANGFKSLNESAKPLEGNFSESYSENDNEIVVNYTIMEEVENATM